MCVTRFFQGLKALFSFAVDEETATELDDGTSVYVELFEEGTTCYRLIPAIQESEDVYLLGGEEFHNADDEVWQFWPGSRVAVQSHALQGNSGKSEIRRLAIRVLSGIQYFGDHGINGSKLIAIERRNCDTIVTVESNGYGRSRGEPFQIVFKSSERVTYCDAARQELYGLCETLEEGVKRHFHLMLTPSEPCLELWADDFSIVELD